jgi:DNA-binding NarL/FixJ family response regulator
MTFANDTLRLLLADDHPIVLSGLEKLLATRSGFEIIAAVTDGQAARHAIRELEPDVAILDINMPKGTGIDVLEFVEQHGFATRVILLTASAGDTQIKRAVQEGVWGIMLKDVAAESLLECIDAVADGRRWLPPEFIEPVFAREEEREKSLEKLQSTLTARERQIAQLVAEGLSNKLISRKLGITEGTVKLHLNKAYSKLDVSNRTSLASFIHRTTTGT